MSSCGQEFEFNENCTLTPGCCFEKVAGPSSPLAPSDILGVKHMGLYFLIYFEKFVQVHYLKIISLMKYFVSLLTYYALKHEVSFKKNSKSSNTSGLKRQILKQW